MWFKNLVVFLVDESLDIDPASLHQLLSEHQFKPCGSQEQESFGWDSPMGSLSDQLFHFGENRYLLTARREERIMPAGAVKDALAKKVTLIELEESRKVGRKQKQELREQLIFEMMPKAFTRSSTVQGLIMPNPGIIVVDTASRKRAEEWLNLLRISLGSLPVRPVEFKQSPTTIFTRWLSGSNLPKQVEIGDECVLQAKDESGAVIRCRKLDLETDEIRAHLKAGKIASQIAVEWNQALQFVVNEDGDIKRLRFSDTTVEQAAQEGVNDPAAEFDARFHLLGLELSQFLPALWQAMGGLANE